MTTKAFVTRVPKCDFCIDKAQFDGLTIYGPWANMCSAHFQVFGVGLGLGKGQRYFLEP